MSINDSQQSVSKPKDIPRVGFTCGSYLAGHNVHYFPVLKRAPLLTPIEASLTSSPQILTLHDAAGPHVVHNHNPTAVGTLIDELGEECLWYPTLSLACLPSAGIRHWVNLSSEPLVELTAQGNLYLSLDESAL
jgi:hypothetical protein